MIATTTNTENKTMTDKNISWIASDQTITVSCDGRTHMLPRTDAYAPKLLEALKAKRFEEVPYLVSAATRIEKFSDGKFQVRDGEILVDGVAAPAILGRKIKDFADQGLPYEPLVRFARNLQRNPSKRAVNELYQFLEKNQFPIQENGTFVAWKKVREDFKDVHSGTFDNSPGKVVEMPRPQVNEDCNQTCSAGLHVAAWHYAESFYCGGKMLEVEVDPADVVSVPVDYDNAKLRACRYKVLRVVEQHQPDLYRPDSSNTVGSEINEDDDEARCLECGGDLVDGEGEFCIDCEETINEEEIPF
jgi:hypothetical protein